MTVISLDGMKMASPKLDEATLRARAEKQFGITILPYRIILRCRPGEVKEEEVNREASRELKQKEGKLHIFSFEVEDKDLTFYETFFTEDLAYRRLSIVKLWYFYR